MQWLSVCFFQVPEDSFQDVLGSPRSFSSDRFRVLSSPPQTLGEEHSRQILALNEDRKDSPTPQQQQQPGGGLPTQKTNTSRYKTELCRPFQEYGACKYGEKCQFAHGKSELRAISRHPKYKTDLCRTYHSVGFCPYGPRCHFIHSLDEIKQKELESAGNATAQTTHSGMPPLPMFSNHHQRDFKKILHESGYNSSSSSSSCGCSPSDFETDADIGSSSPSSPARLPVFSTMSKWY